MAICLVIAILLLPIASRTPKDLILGPVQHLPALIRDDSAAQLVTTPAYTEIKAIQNDFVMLMNDRKKLEDQRLETAQLRTLTRTAQMLAHDIRRPFSLLKATLDGLTQTKTGEEIQELGSETVPGVKKSLEHLDGIIAELTNVVSSTATEQGVFSASEAVRRSVAIAAPNESEAGRISIKIGADAKLYCVQNQIERVVANMVSNALQAIGSNDQICVEATQSDNVMFVSIHNTGSIFHPEDFENIFLPFFTKGKSEGTGLGLAICRRIVVAHNGSITCLRIFVKEPHFKSDFPSSAPNQLIFG